MGPVGAVRLIITAVDKATSPLRQVQARISQIAAPVQRVHGAIGKLSAFTHLAFTHMVRSARAAGSAISTVFGRIRIVGLAAFAGMTFAVKQFLDYSGSVVDAAERLGIGTKALQELRYAAKQVKLDPDELDDGLDRFSKRLSEIRGGKIDSPAADAFKVLGVFEQLRTSTLGLDESMAVVVNAMQSIADPMMKARIADALMGDVRMVNLLGVGLPTLDRFRAQAYEVGQVVGDDVLAAGKKAGLEFAYLLDILKGLTLSIAAELLPAVRQMIRSMSEWAQNRKNQEWLRNELVPALMTIVRIVPRFVTFITRFVGLRTIVLLTALSITGPFIAAIFSLMAAFGLLVVQMALTRGLLLAMGIETAPITFIFGALRTAIFAVIPALQAMLGYVGSLVVMGLRAMAVEVWGLATAALPAFGAAILSLVTVGIPALVSGIYSIAVALLFTPWGLVVVAVLVLVGLGVLLYKKWKPFADFIDRLWERIKNVAQISRTVLGTVWNRPAPAPEAGPRLSQNYVQPDRPYLMKPGQQFAGGAAKVGGRVAVDIGVPRGVTASVRESAPIKGTELDVGVNMVGP